MKRQEEKKQLIKKSEAVLQVAAFTILYYLSWLLAYQDVTFPYLEEENMC